MNEVMKFKRPLAIFLAAVSMSVIVSCKKEPLGTLPNGVTEVKIKDDFWSPKFDQWRTTTVNDVFNKFEGNYDPK